MHSHYPPNDSCARCIDKNSFFPLNRCLNTSRAHLLCPSLYSIIAFGHQLPVEEAVEEMDLEVTETRIIIQLFNIWNLFVLLVFRSYCTQIMTLIGFTRLTNNRPSQAEEVSLFSSIGLISRVKETGK